MKVSLFLRPKCIERPMLIGGGQERGIRSGTESTLLISALGEAARIAHEEKKTLPLRLLSLKLYLVSKLKQVFGSLKNEFQVSLRENVCVKLRTSN